MKAAKFSVEVAKASKFDCSQAFDIAISDGTYLSEAVNTSRANFVLHNKKDEEFRVLLEHDGVLGEGAELTVEIDRPPSEDLALRQRIVPEQRDLLKGLPSSVRLTDTPPPATPAPKRRAPVHKKAGRP